MRRFDKYLSGHFIDSRDQDLDNLERKKLKGKSIKEKTILLIWSSFIDHILCVIHLDWSELYCEQPNIVISTLNTSSSKQTKGNLSVWHMRSGSSFS